MDRSTRYGSPTDDFGDPSLPNGIFSELLVRSREMNGSVGGGRRRWNVGLASLFASALALSQARSADARARGIVVDTCNGCHGGGLSESPELSLTADPATFDPSDLVTFTLTIEHPSIVVGGAFITTSGVGTFEAVAGESLAVNAQGLAHTAPKAAVDGAVSFRFLWQAPPEPGGVDFRVVAVAANGNNASTGDFPGSGAFQWAFGCPGRKFYTDLDRDGYGAEHLGTRLACDGDPAPTGYAALDGDCDENNENVNPGATEVCNRKDDDCNGEVDENAPAVEMWPDEDGDGYYRSRTATPEIGCGGIPGFAALGGDCNDDDPEVNPGATEICNNKDDDCDGEVDDRVRPQCGVGWCARYSSSCDPADCKPGPPGVETCNAFDDDCDGVADNDACPSGMACLASECVADGPLPAAGSDSDAGSDSVVGSDSAAGPNATAGAETSAGVTPTQGTLTDVGLAAATGGVADAGSLATPNGGSNVAVEPSPSIVTDISMGAPPPPDSSESAGCALAVTLTGPPNRDVASERWAAVIGAWLGLGLLRRKMRRSDGRDSPP